MRYVVALFALLLLSFPAQADKVALVIGNGAYANSLPLLNATNDARAMSQRLREIGFSVFEGIDLPRADTLRLVQGFSTYLKPNDTALFFYAGHGMQLGSDNYIMPVDAMPGDEDTLTASSIKLQSILASMENRANTRIIILDACRNNPFLNAAASRSTASGNRGFMRMDAGVGSFIAFSTEPGNVAADGTGPNSPFTTALLRYMGTPGDDLHAVMRKVRAEVKNVSNDRQIPWENSSLIDEVFLTEPPAPRTASVPLGTIEPSSRGNVQNAPTQSDPAQTARVAIPVFSHMVQGLDPNGDGFLSLRAGISSGDARIAKMPEGTRLNILQRSGSWYLVQTETGLQGWAHSNWIAPATVLPAPAPQALSCDQLWYQRNSYFAAHGYCFGSARGKAAFSNANCDPGLAAADVPLTSAEKAAIDRIRAQEAAQGCN